MKLQYKHQKFQTEAARAVVDVFKGQPFVNPTEFVHDQGVSKGMASMVAEYGFANTPIMINRQDLTENVRKIQFKQGLPPINSFEVLTIGGRDYNTPSQTLQTPTLTVEMETGTGKTYTYIKTMYELNKRYGWSKFIIVVPSVAIREGVLKSFQSMEDHFADEYGKRMQYFVYNSKQLSKIDAYATDNGMHCMIINTQAFNSSFDEEKSKGKGRSGDATARIIFDRRDEFGSRRPIDVIAKTNPVMIIDEPQSVLGANKANKTRQGIQLFNPLLLLLYSATHREGDICNMVYRLDAMDAYNRKLVKKIEVKGISQVGTTATNGYFYLEEIVIAKGQNPKARISFDVKTANGTKQKSMLVGEMYDFYEQSGKLAEYRDRCIVQRIDGRAGTVELLNGIVLSEGMMVGNVNTDVIRRNQIRETIRSHFERERDLFAKGIKVLSLFFIDRVENYRMYGEGGSTSLGKFAEMFEQEYINVLSENIDMFNPEYTKYLQRHPASAVHQGYFSQDKKGHFIDSKTDKATGESSDEGAYDLIMKDKERLLSFEEPVRFIFSHSALKEGWDNPNVFQICTLKDSDNVTKKRQEVGRGMRLCVNKYGVRQDQDVLGDHVFNTNILTVIASESYDSFAKQLQHEIAEAVAHRPTKVEPELFENRTYYDAEGNALKITHDIAGEINFALIEAGYIDKKGKLTPKYFDDKRNGNITLDEDFEPFKGAIVNTLEGIYNPDVANVANARTKKIAKFDQDKFFKSRFAELWQQINVRSFYTVDFSSAELVRNAIESIDKHLNVTEIRVVVQHGGMDKIGSRQELMEGMSMFQDKTRTITVNEDIGANVKFDLIGDLVRETGLTRKTIVEILKGIKGEKFLQFRQNPEEFIIKVSKLINEAKAIAVIKKIEYHASTQTYETDLFTADEIRGVVGDNAMESKKSLYDLVVVDSKGTEMEFAEALERNEAVEVYTKLPRGFYINTPMGKYNPDWAIVFREGTVKHVYFIAETKGSLSETQLRESEKSKIECAHRHFASLSNSSVSYDVAHSFQDLLNIVSKP